MEVRANRVKRLAARLNGAEQAADVREAECSLLNFDADSGSEPPSPLPPPPPFSSRGSGAEAVDSDLAADCQSEGLCMVPESSQDCQEGDLKVCELRADVVLFEPRVDTPEHSDAEVDMAGVDAESASKPILKREEFSDLSTEMESDLSSLEEVSELITPPAPIETVLTLIDWDDTLLPTAWLADAGLLESRLEPSDQQRRELAAVADSARELIEAAADLGEVVIVTNAVEGWVQLTCMRFMPSLMPFLRRLPVVSARAVAEPLGTSNQTEWKCVAFEREVEAMFGAQPDGRGVSIVAIGDSQHEHQALRKAARRLPGCCTKSMVFAERPNLQQLFEQHVMVAHDLEEVALWTQDLELDVGVRV